jgi:hypothetical protein
MGELGNARVAAHQADVAPKEALNFARERRDRVSDRLPETGLLKACGSRRAARVSLPTVEDERDPTANNGAPMSDGLKRISGTAKRSLLSTSSCSFASRSASIAAAAGSSATFLRAFGPLLMKPFIRSADVKSGRTYSWRRGLRVGSLLITTNKTTGVSVAVTR